MVCLFVTYLHPIVEHLLRNTLVRDVCIPEVVVVGLRSASLETWLTQRTISLVVGCGSSRTFALLPRSLTSELVRCRVHVTHLGLTIAILTWLVTLVGATLVVSALTSDLKVVLVFSSAGLSRLTAVVGTVVEIV